MVEACWRCFLCLCCGVTLVQLSVERVLVERVLVERVLLRGCWLR